MHALCMHTLLLHTECILRKYMIDVNLKFSVDGDVVNNPPTFVVSKELHYRILNILQNFVFSRLISSACLLFPDQPETKDLLTNLCPSQHAEASSDTAL